MSVFAALALVVAAIAPAAAPQQLFDLPDSRITEASGIARGIASPDVYYVQNDSGDSARFFAIDASTGALRAVVQVPGAVNHDWEDIAVAPDAAGTPSVWIADIGDNDANRDEVHLYRVDEPHIVAGGLGGTVTTSAPDVWRLRYPSGPANAESLAVTPSGHAYVFTKSATGAAAGYAVPPRPDPDHVQVMRPIGTLQIPPLATGAAISRDGSLLAVRTYFAVFLWRLHHGDVAAAIRGKPIEETLPVQRQGEGVGFSDGRLVVDSEGVHEPVWSVPLPAGLRSHAPRASTMDPVITQPRSPSPSPSGSSNSNSTKSPLLATLALIAAGIVFLAVRKLRGRG
jgi:hypothetical protein